MSTKLLNKLVNICSNLDGGTSSSLIDVIYPVGSIYTSMNSTDPSEIFGGTWEQITNRFLYCADSSKETGGSSTITEANLPEHTHIFNGSEATEIMYVRPLTNSSGIIVNETSNGCFTYSTGTGKSFATSISIESTANNSDQLTWTYTPTGTLSNTGSGEEFLPPYITVYAWYRTA